MYAIVNYGEIMKILLLSRKRFWWKSTWASMKAAFGRYFDVKYYGKGYPNYGGERRIDVLKVIEKFYLGDYPDVVLQTSPHLPSTHFYDMDNYEKANCLRVMWLADFHNDIGRKEVYEYLKAGNVDLVIKNYDVRNESEWGRKLIETGVPIEWCPFSIDPEIFHDMSQPKIYDVINLGQLTTQNYPFRWRVEQMLKSQEDIKYYKRSKKTQPVWGVDYAKLINQSRIMATDCSTYNFAVQKMFETMACNTLLICNTPRSAKELGFKPGLNYVHWGHEPKQSIDVDDEMVMNTISYYLDNPDEAAKIALRGHELVHSRHTHDVRMKEFLSILEKYI